MAEEESLRVQKEKGKFLTGQSPGFYSNFKEVVARGREMNVFSEKTDLTAQSPCHHRGFLFLYSLSKHQKQPPIPGTISHLHRQS